MTSISRLCRRLAPFLAAMLAALLVVACGGDGNDAPEATAISSQPASATVVAGGGASFSVTARGTTLVYQWQRSTDAAASWSDIAGASASTYTIATVDVSMSGQQFRVGITGANGAVTSSAATLTVTAAPTPAAITTQPADQAVVEGASANFSVTATGTSLAYQWQSSPDGTTWTDVSGATSATFTLAATTLAESGTHYRVVVGNSLGNVDSSAASLSVTAASAAPAITTQPVAASVTAGQTATFTAAATGNPAPVYQWQRSVGGGAYADIAGATGTSYTTPATLAGNTGTLYRVHVSNSIGDAFSAAATLTVTAAAAAPVITIAPLDQSAAVGATATFIAAASGTPSPTFQWQLSTDGGATFANINGATTAIYTTPAATLADSGKRFRVVASNSAGSATSNSAQLFVAATTLGGFPAGVVITGSGALDVSTDVSFAGIQSVDTTTGAVTSVAGSTIGGLTDGTGSAARFESPEGIALDAAGNLYIVDNTNNAIRMMTPAGVVTTIAGNGTRGYVDATGSAAEFALPQGIAVDAAGTVYVADTSNHAVRKIAAGGVVTTLAKSSATVQLNGPTGIAIDGNGVLYVADGSNIRLVSQAGVVTTFVSGIESNQLVLDGAGNLYVTGGNLVQKITPAGVVTILAGSTTPGAADGTGAAASFKGPAGLAIDASGNLYVADLLNHAIRKITPAGVVTTVVH